MATSEQIAAALKRAHAAGDTAAAKKLAAAYKAAQTQSAQPEAPGMMDIGARFAAKRAADPVTAEYNMALQQLRELYPQMSEEQFQTFVKGKKSMSPMAPIGNLPVVGGILAPGTGDIQGAAGPLNLQQIAQNDQLFGFGDEIGAGASALGDMSRGVDPRSSYAAWERLNRARREKGVQDNGVAGKVASAVGQLTSLGPGKMATVPASLPKTVATSATTGAGMGAVEGFGSADGDLAQRVEGAKTGAVTGATVGAVVPLAFEAGGRAVHRAAQNRATDAAIKNAPTSDDLADAASQLFKSSKASGVAVKPNVFGTFAQKTAAAAKAADIDQELDGGAWAVYDRMIELAREGFADPAALSLSRLHNLRQKAQDVVLDATKNRTKNFAQQIIDGLDDMIGKLKPSDMNIPPNRLGGANNAGNALLDGISTWAKAKKVSLIESAIRKAQNYPSGVESGLRSQFRTLLNNNKTSKLFTKQEVRALKAVVNGTLPVTALRALGIFRGLGGAVLGSMLGGPLGTVVGGVAGIGGRKITEMATEQAAQRAGKVVATPSLPQIPYTPRRLPATTLPLLLSGG